MTGEIASPSIPQLPTRFVQRGFHSQQRQLRNISNLAVRDMRERQARSDLTAAVSCIAIASPLTLARLPNTWSVPSAKVD
jgi:hypothetical protein